MSAERPEWVALETLRRGWRGSRELRQGALLTVALVMVGAGGRLVVPILVQQSIDNGITNDGVDIAHVVRLAVIGAVVIVVCTFATRAAVVRLARRSEHALYGLRTRAFAHIHA